METIVVSLSVFFRISVINYCKQIVCGIVTSNSAHENFKMAFTAAAILVLILFYGHIQMF